jgi:hypothetical protein
LRAQSDSICSLLLTLLLLQAARRKRRVMRHAQHPTLHQSLHLRLQLLHQHACLSTKSLLHWQGLQLQRRCQTVAPRQPPPQQQQIQRPALQDSSRLHHSQRQQQQLLLLVGDRWLGRLGQQVLAWLHLQGQVAWQRCGDAAELLVVLLPLLKVSVVCRSGVLS